MISIFSHEDDKCLLESSIPDITFGDDFEFSISKDIFSAITSKFNKVTIIDVKYGCKYYEPLEVLDLTQYDSWVKLKKYVPDLDISDVLGYLVNYPFYKEIIDLFITEPVDYPVPTKIEEYLVSKNMYCYQKEPEVKIPTIEESYYAGNLLTKYLHNNNDDRIIEFISGLDKLDTVLFPCTVDQYIKILSQKYDFSQDSHELLSLHLKDKLTHFFQYHYINEHLEKIPAMLLYAMGNTSYLQNTYMFDTLYNYGWYGAAFDIYDKGAVFSIIKDEIFTRQVLEKRRVFLNKIGDL